LNRAVEFRGLNCFMQVLILLKEEVRFNVYCCEFLDCLRICER